MADTQWKNLWQQAPLPAPKTAAGLKPLLRRHNHPVIRRIRLQLMWEACIFSLVLLSYYNIFDGDRKPLYANLILAAACLGVLAHSLLGYLQLGQPPAGAPLREALDARVKRLRIYSIFSILSRGLWTLALGTFFATTPTAHRWVFPVAFSLLLLGQLVWLSRLWKARIRTLEEAIALLSTEESMSSEK